MISAPRALAVLLTTLVLVGCGTEADDIIETTKTKMAADFEKLSGVDNKNTIDRSSPLEIKDSLWLGDHALQMERGKPLPDRWQTSNAIALRADTPLSLSQIAAIISSQTSIPVRLQDGSDQLGLGLGGASPPPAAPPPTGPGGPGGSPTPVNPQQSMGSAATGGMTISYEGGLAGLLDLVTGYYNVNWTYDGSAVTVYRYQTLSFVIEALPGNFTVAIPGAGSGDSGGSGGSSGGSSSSSSSGSSSDSGGDLGATPLSAPTIDLWADIDSSLNTIIAGDGSFTISQNTGTILISTTAEKMRRSAQYIRDINDRLSRQVSVTLEIYRVSLTDEEQHGLDAAQIVTTLGGDIFSVGYEGPASGLDGTGNLSFTINKPPALAGTNGVFQALSTLGNTVRVAQIPMTTLNNRPTGQRIALDRQYVARTASTTTTGTATSTSGESEPATASTGIAVSILPRIMDDGRIILQYALGQQELLSLTPAVTPSGTISLPTTQSFSFSQQVVLPSGSTLVLAGFDESTAESNKIGVGSPLTWMLGGSVGQKKTHQMVVITITPREITIPRSGDS